MFRWLFLAIALLVGSCVYGGAAGDSGYSWYDGGYYPWYGTSNFYWGGPAVVGRRPAVAGRGWRGGWQGGWRGGWSGPGRGPAHTRFRGRRGGFRGGVTVRGGGPVRRSG